MTPSRVLSQPITTQISRVMTFIIKYRNDQNNQILDSMKSRHILELHEESRELSISVSVCVEFERFLAVTGEVAVEIYGEPLIHYCTEGVSFQS